MRFRLPLFRRAHGGTLPGHRPDPDSIPAMLSPGRSMCDVCSTCHQCGAVAPGPAGDSDTMMWLICHDCIEETT